MNTWLPIFIQCCFIAASLTMAHGAKVDNKKLWYTVAYFQFLLCLGSIWRLRE